MVDKNKETEWKHIAATRKKKPWELDGSDIATMNNKNNTSCLFEWVCDDRLDDCCDDTPRVCKVISVDCPGCTRMYMANFKRSLEPVELPKRKV
jgi:hypothetical protein